MKPAILLSILFITTSCSKPQSLMVLLSGPNSLTGTYQKEKAGPECESLFLSEITIEHKADPAKAVDDTLTLKKTNQILGHGTYDSGKTIRLTMGKDKVSCAGAHMQGLLKLNCIMAGKECLVSLRKK